MQIINLFMIFGYDVSEASPRLYFFSTLPLTVQWMHNVSIIIIND